jgi:hypothetical protein
MVDLNIKFVLFPKFKEVNFVPFAAEGNVITAEWFACAQTPHVVVRGYRGFVEYHSKGL